MTTKRELMHHQTVAVDWITAALQEGTYKDLQGRRQRTMGVLLTDAPGLGKTASALVSLLTLRESGCMLGMPCLVVCPVNCIAEWSKEVVATFSDHCFDVRVFKDSHTFDDMHANTLVLMSYTALLSPFAAWASQMVPDTSDAALVMHYQVANKRAGNNDVDSQQEQRARMAAFFEKVATRYAKKAPPADAVRVGTHMFSSKSAPWGCVVLDEAHKVKSSIAVSAKCLAMVRSFYRIALTGTPVMNNTGEFHNIMRYALLYGRNAGSEDVSSDLYRMCVFGHKRSEVQLVGPPVQTALDMAVHIATDGFEWDRQLYLDVLLRTRMDAAELANSATYFMGETSKQHAERVRAAARKFFGSAQALQFVALHPTVYLGGNVWLPAFAIPWTRSTHMQFPRWFRTRVETFLLCMKRASPLLGRDVHRLICTTWAHSENSVTQPSPKLLATYDIYKSMCARNANDKLLIISGSRVFLEHCVQPYFTERQVGSVLLCGGITTQAKQVIINRFERDPAIRVMCAVKGVVGLGLNLQYASSTVILCEPGWNDAVDLQAVARVDRTGQTRQPYIYRLLWSNSVDTAMMQLQAAKREVATSAVFKHTDLKVSTALCKMIDMDPKTALRPRPGDAPVTYNQGFVNPKIVLKKPLEPQQKKQRLDE